MKTLFVALSPFLPLVAAGAQTLTVKSESFAQNSAIPARYTGDGQDLSPALEWQGVPAGTKELALICDDPDAPSKTPWVHWVVYKIPTAATSLAEGAGRGGKETVQGKNSWGTEGYRGPAPPPGKTHHYHFRLYALDQELPDERGLNRAAIDRAISGHVLAQGEIVGTYQR